MPKVMNRRDSIATWLGVVLVVVLFVVPLFTPVPVAYLQAQIGEQYLVSSVAFTGLMFLATVVAPVSVLPLVPAVAPFLGPLVTALLAIVGWTLGSIVAFLLARRFGRPLILNFVSSEKIARYEAYIPEKSLFWWIVLLRMIIPVDVLSYALGLVSRVALLPYTIATIIGITPFSFIFAYGGEALLEGKYRRVVLLLGLAVVIFLFVTALLKSRKP